jgi:hypothetical protein
MTPMSRKDEEALAARMEADAADPDLWEDVTPSNDYQPARLGAEITIFLGPDLNERLTERAREHGGDVVALVQSWVEQRLKEPTSSPTAQIDLTVGSGKTFRFLVAVREAPPDEPSPAESANVG